MATRNPNRENQLRLVQVVEIPWFTGFQKQPRWWSPDFFHQQYELYCRFLGPRHWTTPQQWIFQWRSYPRQEDPRSTRFCLTVDRFWLVKHLKWFNCCDHDNMKAEWKNHPKPAEFIHDCNFLWGSFPADFRTNSFQPVPTLHGTAQHTHSDKLPDAILGV